MDKSGRKSLGNLIKLDNEIKKIEDIIELFSPPGSRYRLRSLFFPKRGSIGVKWGHSYGLDQLQFDLEVEDTAAIVEYFKKKLDRLNKEFHSLGFS